MEPSVGGQRISVITSWRCAGCKMTQEVASTIQKKLPYRKYTAHIRGQRMSNQKDEMPNKSFEGIAANAANPQ